MDKIADINNKIDIEDQARAHAKRAIQDLE
jgi:hypothetical protein